MIYLYILSIYLSVYLSIYILYVYLSILDSLSGVDVSAVVANIGSTNVDHIDGTNVENIGTTKNDEEGML